MLSSIKPQLSELNIGLIAIGCGTSLMAKNFQEEFNFSGDLFVDKKREVYKALGCNRGLKYVLSTKTLKAAKEINAEGFSQGKTQGDSLQLGGVFVISRTRGVLFQHNEKFAGDHVDIDMLLKACKEIGSKE